MTCLFGWRTLEFFLIHLFNIEVWKLFPEFLIDEVIFRSKFEHFWVNSTQKLQEREHQWGEGWHQSMIHTLGVGKDCILWKECGNIVIKDSTIINVGLPMVNLKSYWNTIEITFCLKNSLSDKIQMNGFYQSS